jgi:hypothetical protein
MPRHGKYLGTETNRNSSEQQKNANVHEPWHGILHEPRDVFGDGQRQRGGSCIPLDMAEELGGRISDSVASVHHLADVPYAGRIESQYPLI